MPTTMWSASFSCWLITEAGSNRLCGGSFTFNFWTNGVFRCSGFVSQVQTWIHVMLSWRCTNGMSEISSRAEEIAAIVSVIYHFVLLHYGGDESTEEFIHTSVLGVWGAEGNQNVLLSLCWSNSLVVGVCGLNDQWVTRVIDKETLLLIYWLILLELYRWVWCNC